MIQKLLIANRGEIACRVIATARRMGIATVAIYSQVDAHSSHVSMADEAVALRADMPQAGYLDGQQIIAAALLTGADAIHPGYGFLSENPGFAEAVVKAGLIFVGPPAEAIRAMGLKDAAKLRMQEADVPVVPGYHLEDQEPKVMQEAALEIGFPVLIKARAGGGGKGMRRVDDRDNFAEALKAAQREAAASFGDPACLIEKYIETPRHIEVQIFADAHGNIIHLFERDCSLQRRHQKVIEEAPAPDMPQEMRAKICAAAIEAARAIGYVGAGTVEFIADASQGLNHDGFWFMEMNTRLQVEHPVTEAVTGIDLVEWQLNVAAGGLLPLAQDEVPCVGHAIEARIYAEDPARGFLPATGQLSKTVWPAHSAFAHGVLRVDSYLRAGDTISTFYDPMIGKLIAYGEDRASALRALRRALTETRMPGLVTNQGFLERLLAHEDVARGLVETGLIAAHPKLAAVPNAPFAVLALGALYLCDALRPNLGTVPRHWRHWGQGQDVVTLSLDGIACRLNIITQGDHHVISYDGTDHIITVTEHSEPNLFQVQSDGQSQTLSLFKGSHSAEIFFGADRYEISAIDPLAVGAHAEEGSEQISAPMPGLIKSILSQDAASLKKGDAILILEAMKMEHRLVAQQDGVLAEVFCAEGDQVEEGTILARMEYKDE